MSKKTRPELSAGSGSGSNREIVYTATAEAKGIAEKSPQTQRSVHVGHTTKVEAQDFARTALLKSGSSSFATSFTAEAAFGGRTATRTRQSGQSPFTKEAQAQSGARGISTRTHAAQIQQAPASVHKPAVTSNADRKYIARVFEALPSFNYPIDSLRSLAAQLDAGTLSKALNTKVDIDAMIGMLPAYYFPITSLQNFIEKAVELMRNGNAG